MKIVTIVPYKWNFHKKFYNKDIIQIWRTLAQKLKGKSEYWAISNWDFKKEFKLREQKWVGHKNYLSIVLQLAKQSKKIDILHLYHIGRHPFILWIAYKLFNRKWKIYLKTDLAYKSTNSKSVLSINDVILRAFFYIFDYIWVEDKIMLKNFQEKVPSRKTDFMLLPSWTIYIKEFDWNILKKNKISLCWRFWDNVKNYEIFLEVLENHDINFLKNWEIYFLGEYTTNFKKRYDKLLIKKPFLKRVLSLKWFIQEKEELFSFLSKSNIVIHTSFSEWDPNFQYDSMFCWCYLISSDVWNIKDNYPEDFSCFFNPNNSNDLYLKIKDKVTYIDNWNSISYLKIQEHCIKNFTWEKSLEKLIDKIEK